jgi:hypothetical protein
MPGSVFWLRLSFVGLVVELDFDVSEFRCLSLPVLCLLYNTSKQGAAYWRKSVKFWHG